MPEFTLCFSLKLVDDPMAGAFFFFSSSSCCRRACSALARMAAFCLGCFSMTDADRVGGAAAGVPEDEGDSVLF